jgi:hypothetical protein
METARPKTKLGLDREVMYIGGELVFMGATFYYDATVENARVEKKRKLSGLRSAIVSADNVEGYTGYGCTQKDKKTWIYSR